MKLVSIFAVAVLATTAQSKPTSVVIDAPFHGQVYQLAPRFSITTSLKKPEVDLCDTCIQFAGAGINELLNLILDKGLTGSCNKLCGALGKQLPGLQKACNIICEVEGIKAFINWIEHSDLSPIYDCQEINICKFNDHGDAEIVDFGVTPLSGPQATNFAVKLDWATKNGTSTGEIRFGIQTMDHQQLDIPSVYLPDTTVGDKFTLTLNVDTTPSAPTCDPSQQTCEGWFFGKYNLTALVCEGECGDTKHPHTSLYASANSSFIITKGPPAPPGPPGPPGPPPPPAPPGTNPWADPNAGTCPNGEKPVQVTGLKGSFCSPVCKKTSDCPAAPTGTSATPECVLELSGSQTPTNCALICANGATCPAKASCKSIQGTGICTFDN